MLDYISPSGLSGSFPTILVDHLTCIPNSNRTKEDIKLDQILIGESFKSSRYQPTVHHTDIETDPGTDTATIS